MMNFTCNVCNGPKHPQVHPWQTFWVRIQYGWVSWGCRKWTWIYDLWRIPKWIPSSIWIPYPSWKTYKTFIISWGKRNQYFISLTTLQEPNEFWILKLPPFPQFFWFTHSYTDPNNSYHFWAGLLYKWLFYGVADNHEYWSKMPSLPIISINFSWAKSHNFFIMEKSKFTMLFIIC